jgi:hypothetical protein
VCLLLSTHSSVVEVHKARHVFSVLEKPDSAGGPKKVLNMGPAKTQLSVLFPTQAAQDSPVVEASETPEYNFLPEFTCDKTDAFLDSVYSQPLTITFQDLGEGDVKALLGTAKISLVGLFNGENSVTGWYSDGLPHYLSAFLGGCRWEGCTIANASVI